MSNYVFIGSRAIKHWFPDFREPRGDWDWWVKEEGDRKISAPGTVDKLVEPRLWDGWTWGRVATPDELYTMKISHIYWEIGGSTRNWDKHAADIVFLERKGCQFLPELHDILFPLWQERYRPHRTNLNQTKDKFFQDAVVRKYDHDSLHDTVSYHPYPLYRVILREGSEVDCDWNLFQRLQKYDQLNLLREEVYVTALERILIPRDYTGSPTAAYYWALRRCITSLFRGVWATEFALNLDALMRPDVNYVQRHLSRRELLTPLTMETK